MWIADAFSVIPNSKISLGEAYSQTRPPYKSVLHTQHTIKCFSASPWWSTALQPPHSLHYILPDQSSSTPESLFSFPCRSLPLSLLSQRGRNFQQLLVSLQQKTAEDMHTSRSSRNTTYSYSRCVICVHVCVCVCDMWIHVSAYVRECIHLLANATKLIIIWFISPNNDQGYSV